MTSRRPTVPQTLVMDRFDSLFASKYKYGTRKVLVLSVHFFCILEQYINQLDTFGYQMVNVGVTVPVTPPSLESIERSSAVAPVSPTTSASLPALVQYLILGVLILVVFFG